MEEHKNFKLKNIVVFCICCLGWILTVIKLGTVSVTLSLIPLLTLSTIAIWQLNLSNEKNNVAILTFFLIDLILSILLSYLGDGDVEGAVIAIISGFFIVGGGVLIAFIYIRASKKEDNRREFMKNQYSTEQREKICIKLYNCAKGAVVIGEIAGVSVYQAITALCVSIIYPISNIILGVDMDKNNICSTMLMMYANIGIGGMLFGLIGGLCWVLISIRFSRLRHHVQDESKGEEGLNLFVNQENLNGNDIKKLGGKEKYLLLHNQKLINRNIFNKINISLMVVQIVCAIVVYIIGVM